MLTATTTLDVQFGDCDPAGIVFYPNYFRWFDAALDRAFRSAGIDGAEKRRFPLVDAGSEFLGPAATGDVLTIRTTVVEVGAKTMKVAHEVLRGEPPIARGREVRVRVGGDPADPKKLKAEVIPDALRAVLTR